jgi:hypothetical protein
MNDDRTVRVTLLGDRSGDYVVVEERPDGSLVLAPDGSRGRERGRRRDSTGSSISRLVTRRVPGPATIHEALDEWGFELGEDEFVTDFLTAKVDGRTGFAAVTNRRVVFFARRGAELRAIDEHLLSDVREVELVRRPFKSVLRVCWDDSETEIAGELDALTRLREQLRGG